MSVKDEILQRRRAEKMHARGVRQQVRLAPVARDGLRLPENEQQLRESMKPPTGIDVDAAYAKWNEDWLTRKRRLEGRGAVTSEAPDEPAAAEVAPATTPAPFDSEAIYAKRNGPRG